MTASVFATVQHTPQREATAASAKRLAAAGAVSVLLHVALLELSGGSGSRAGTAVMPQDLTVRLIRVAPSPPEEERQAAVAPHADAPTPTTAERPWQPISDHKTGRAHAERAEAHPARPTSNGGASVAEAPDLNYYGARQLDVYPALAAPLQLGRLTQSVAGSGRALLLVLIDAGGLVNEVSVVEATPQSIQEDAARRVFMSARFTPAYRNGRAVRSRMLVEVSYGDETRTP